MKSLTSDSFKMGENVQIFQEEGAVALCFMGISKIESVFSIIGEKDVNTMIENFHYEAFIRALRDSKEGAKPTTEVALFENHLLTSGNSALIVHPSNPVTNRLSAFLMGVRNRLIIEECKNKKSNTFKNLNTYVIHGPSLMHKAKSQYKETLDPLNLTPIAQFTNRVGGYLVDGAMGFKSSIVDSRYGLTRGESTQENVLVTLSQVEQFEKECDLALKKRNDYQLGKKQLEKMQSIHKTRQLEENERKRRMDDIQTAQDEEALGRQKDKEASKRMTDDLTEQERHRQMKEAELRLHTQHDRLAKEPPMESEQEERLKAQLERDRQEKLRFERARQAQIQKNAKAQQTAAEHQSKWEKVDNLRAQESEKQRQHYMSPHPSDPGDESLRNAQGDRDREEQNRAEIAKNAQMKKNAQAQADAAKHRLKWEKIHKIREKEGEHHRQEHLSNPAHDPRHVQDTLIDDQVKRDRRAQKKWEKAHHTHIDRNDQEKQRFERHQEKWTKHQKEQDERAEKKRQSFLNPKQGSSDEEQMRLLNEQLKRDREQSNLAKEAQHQNRQRDRLEREKALAHQAKINKIQHERNQEAELKRQEYLKRNEPTSNKGEHIKTGATRRTYQKRPKRRHSLPPKGVFCKVYFDKALKPKPVGRDFLAEFLEYNTSQNLLNRYRAHRSANSGKLKKMVTMFGRKVPHTRLRQIERFSLFCIKVNSHPHISAVEKITLIHHRLGVLQNELQKENNLFDSALENIVEQLRNEISEFAQKQTPKVALGALSPSLDSTYRSLVQGGAHRVHKRRR